MGLIRIIRKFYNYYVSPDKALIRRLASLIGFVPTNINLFNLAFSHKSSTNQELYAIQNNERLEYLGDAILGTIVAEYLFRKYPNRDEGFLTKMRSKIVNRKVMNEIGDGMGLDIFIVHNNNSRLSRSMLGNALEALIGAIYLDVGYHKTQRFVIKRILKAHLDIQALETYDDNYKSQLLEWCQKNRKEVTYNVLDKFKLDNRDRFRVAVLIDGLEKAAAEDFSKKSAEQKASQKALLKIGSFDSEKGTFSAWIYRIARNSVIDHYRTNKSEVSIEDVFDVGVDERTAEALDAISDLKKVTTYLETLSAKQREIITLRVWEEMSYKEIAALVGGSEDSVKMAFSRGIRDLREKCGPISILTLFLACVPVSTLLFKDLS